MSFLTLFSDKNGFVGTEQLVYTADEFEQLSTVQAQVSSMSDLIADQEKLNEQSARDGYQAGFEQGQQAATQASSNAIAQELLKLQQAYNAEIEMMRSNCATLAVDIVRKIAGQVRPAEWLSAEARTAAQELVQQDKLVLRVHSSQLDDVQSSLSESSEHTFLRVVADEAVAPNACSIETQFGRVDVDLDTQIKHILDLLDAKSSAIG